MRHALLTARRGAAPFRHWAVREALPPTLWPLLLALPFTPPRIRDTNGRRETHNASRLFVTESARAGLPACAALAEAFQDEATVGLIEDMCGVDLAGTSLRIECCLDTAGFWLEPHTDIGAKRFTMLIYLSLHEDAESWGTDLLDAGGKLVARASGGFNTGLVFVPGADTWHGFAPRPIAGVRRSLIVNYVGPEWRARHELAYPGQPVA
ncbi:MAG: 2OG-Fe(II) oxygenase [Rhodospirillales bacterium]|nr:2OG-Fe(II) oxygenase [Rhodospirillales bacterium]